MTNPAAGASLSGLSLVAALLLAGFLVVGQPVVGRWSHRRFEAALARDRQARLRRYRRTLVAEWVLVGMALVLVGLAPGMTLGQVGVRPPRGNAATVVAAVGVVATVALFVRARRVLLRHGDRPIAGPRAVLALLPRTVRERRAFALLSVTAGVCEETLYRGVLAAVVTALWPGVGAVGAAMLSAAAFGLAHLYQGAVGVVTSTVLGACLGVLYLATGSLVLPACYHALVDLRILLVPPTRLPR